MVVISVGALKTVGSGLNTLPSSVTALPLFTSGESMQHNLSNWHWDHTLSIFNVLQHTFRWTALN